MSKTMYGTAADVVLVDKSIGGNAFFLHCIPKRFVSYHKNITNTIIIYARLLENSRILDYNSIWSNL